MMRDGKGSGNGGVMTEMEVQELQQDFDSIKDTATGKILLHSRQLWRQGT